MTNRTSVSTEIKPWRKANAYLDSLLSMERDDSRALDFHGAFVPDVARSLILRHTKPGDWIWDPFGGSGTSLLAAADLGRNCFLSDLTPKRENIYQGDARTIRPQILKDRPALMQAKWQELYEDFQFDLVILHPPYHNIIQFSDTPGDLSNCDSVEEFLDLFQSVAENVAKHLRPKGYLGLVIGDAWADAQWLPLGFWCMERALTALGPKARLKAIQIKNIEGNRANAHRANLMRSRAFAWGSVIFKHEYIASLQKK